MVAKSNSARFLVRRLLPAVVLVPVVLGWLRLEGERAGLYGTTTGTVLFAAANILIISALTLYSTRLLARVVDGGDFCSAKLMLVVGAGFDSSGSSPRRSSFQSARRSSILRHTHHFTAAIVRVRQFVDGVQNSGAFYAAQQVLPAIVEAGRGTVLLPGATASLRGSARFSALAVGKFGLRALAQSMAREFGPQGVHVAHVIVDG